VLDEIAAGPLDALELGPVGYLPEDPAELRAALAERSLTAVGSFVFDDLHDPAERPRVVGVAERACAAIAAAGGGVLVVIDSPSVERVAAAGRSAAAPRLDGAGWQELLAGIEAVAAVARAAGLRPAVHPHAGGYLEFEDEIERLLAEIDADQLGLCLDTGHALYAGADPAVLIRRHAARLEHLHLKDVATARDRRLGFWDAVRAGVFCPVGDGELDLHSVHAALADAGYAGFATVEQDRRPGSPGRPQDDLRRSVARLRAAGIGSDIVPA
jgi:inosose dehydratase